MLKMNRSHLEKKKDSNIARIEQQESAMEGFNETGRSSQEDRPVDAGDYSL
jgi:hypothetical protein